MLWFIVLSTTAEFTKSFCSICLSLMSAISTSAGSALLSGSLGLISAMFSSCANSSTCADSSTYYMGNVFFFFAIIGKAFDLNMEYILV